MPLTPRIRRVHALAGATCLGATLLAACASHRANAPVDQIAVTPTTIQVQGNDLSNINFNLINEDRAESHVVKAPLDSVWRILPNVFADLALPVNLYVDKEHQIGAKGARFRGRVGKTRMSEYVTCGSDITGEDRANSYEITLDVLSAVGPLDNGQTNLLTRVVANGRPLSTAGEPVRCTSTGAIERRIAAAATVRLATK